MNPSRLNGMMTSERCGESTRPAGVGTVLELSVDFGVSSVYRLKERQRIEEEMLARALPSSVRAKT